MSLWSRNFQSLEGKFRGLKNGVELGVSASNLRIAMVQEWKVGGHLGLILGLGRSPGEGNGCPLQYSGLENSMDCTVPGVAKS